MKILGINGLGVLPSACIVEDGKLLVFAEEERYSRLKSSFGFMPSKAVRFCLDSLSLELEDIDYIAFGWDCNRYKFKMPFFLLAKYFTRSPKFQASSNVVRFLAEIIKYTPSNVSYEIKEMFRSEGFKGTIPPIHFVSHHLSHAASSFYHSGFENAYVLVIDGSGENKCTSIYKGEGSVLKLVDTVKIPDSIGWFYQSVTEFLGFNPNSHEGKTMALAAYGNYNKEISDKIDRIIYPTASNYYRHDAKYSFLGTHEDGIIYSEQFVSLFGRGRKKGEELTQFHKDLAFATQHKLESIVTSIVEKITTNSDFRGNLCLAGGVTLNCKMNGRIAALKNIDNMYVPSVPSDAGTALGAALVLSEKLEVKNFERLNHAYWGSSYTDEFIEKTLVSLGISFQKSDNIEKETAQILAMNKTVAWFQGTMEIGSRALGNRSILGNPSNPKMRDIINEKVKQRELWRPFAASILQEDCHLYFEDVIEAPFMAVSYTVKETARQSIISAIHIDGSTRPQIVTKESNPTYYSLISFFKEQTGVGAVLNTSFNNNEEPIVENPIQAVKVFFSSGLDYLAIGSFLIKKEYA